jgi:hypothetical protein
MILVIKIAATIVMVVDILKNIPGDCTQSLIPETGKNRSNKRRA